MGTDQGQYNELIAGDVQRMETGGRGRGREEGREGEGGGGGRGGRRGEGGRVMHTNSKLK